MENLMEKSIQEKSVKETKDIICLDDIHGFVSNIRIVYFDEKNYQEMLSQDMNASIKRELVHACYMSKLVAHIKEGFKLSEKRNQGDNSIRLNRTLNHIKNYTDDMINKIKGHISIEEFNEAVYIIENALSLNVQEKQQLQILVVDVLKQALQLNVVKNKITIKG